jgi:hypothetical protein
MHARARARRWVDSAATIVIGLLLAWEGAETLRAATRADFDGCVCCGTSIPFVYKRLHARLRTKSGALLVPARGKPRPAVPYTESAVRPASAAPARARGCGLCASTQHALRACPMLDATSPLSPFASLQQRWVDERWLVQCRLCARYEHATRDCPLLDGAQPHEHALLQQRWLCEDYGQSESAERRARATASGPGAGVPPAAAAGGAAPAA